jgi:hypothetical protein
MSSHGGRTRVAERTRSTSVAARTTRPRAPKEPKTPKPLTATQRKTIATQKILQALAASDQGLAITAALEAVSERLAWDRELQRSVREKYDDLQALGAVKHKKDVGPMPPLIRTPGLNRQSPLHVLDPYELALDYGRDQLRNVLSRASQPNLKVAVGLVKERNPGKKPSGQSSPALVDFIVEHVAGPGY